VVPGIWIRKSGKPEKGRGVGSWLMMAVSPPRSRLISERAKAVQRESPSGRRCEVMTIRFDARSLAAMSALGSAAMLLGLLDQPIDPRLMVRSRIQGEK
jgi:hypothetical protein